MRSREHNLINVLKQSWSAPFSTKSRFARVYVDDISYAASLGLITTLDERKAKSRVWRITPEGLRLLSAWYDQRQTH